MPATRRAPVTTAILVIFLVTSCVSTPTKDPDLLPVRCLDVPDLDLCSGNRVGYYYDYWENRCRPFHYGNCPLQVPFATLADCDKTCVAPPDRG
ncbi:BPTI/Kunitz-type proteinase inhibitor domain-containing protein [Thioalkalicoccus limnaeus]|uniref:BPTI/Kunitz-type proteinase inhibitor domain-containing protein n=1 Tax=Thioalkalicoccus limnaeus TaxID=120681 RepID=A0ABV4BBE9_9GAMM